MVAFLVFLDLTDFKIHVSGFCVYVLGRSYSPTSQSRLCAVPVAVLCASEAPLFGHFAGDVRPPAADTGGLSELSQPLGNYHNHLGTITTALFYHNQLVTITTACDYTLQRIPL